MSGLAASPASMFLIFPPCFSADDQLRRRKVKCSEEHPLCSRCIRGGFVCAGYAVPKPWIFRSTAEAQTTSRASSARPGPCEDPQPVNSTNLTRRLYPSTQRLPPALLCSPLQLGNSDPFGVHATPIGPRESHLLTIYRKVVVPRIYHPALLSLGHVDSFNFNCLKDEVTACALLARNSAVEGFTLRSRHATPSTSFFEYMTRGCAILRRRLSLMDGSESASVMLPIMWATCLLATAEMFTSIATGETHLRAMSELVVRYIRSLDGKLEEASPILIMTFVDNMRACATLSRPMIDACRWFPRLFQDLWDRANLSHRTSQAGNHNLGFVHADVQDRILKDIIVSRRGREQNSGESQTHWTVVFSQVIFQHYQLLQVTLDAIEQLKTFSTNTERMQRQSVRGYLSASLLLWIQTNSRTPFINDALFGLRSSMLRHIKNMVNKDLLAQKSSKSQTRAYTDARLWALFIAIQVQLGNRETLDPDLICDEWFLRTFRTEAKSIQIHSWQQAVPIFEQFLYDDQLEPHISQWWHRIVFEHRPGGDGAISVQLQAREDVETRPNQH